MRGGFLSIRARLRLGESRNRELAWRDEVRFGKMVDEIISNPLLNENAN
jgi:hypothetical protein